MRRLSIDLAPRFHARADVLAERLTSDLNLSPDDLEINLVGRTHGGDMPGVAYGFERAEVGENALLEIDLRQVLSRSAAMRLTNGQTFYQWARDLFEFENCAECGKGVRGHEPRIVMGNWFAHCKSVPTDA